MSVSVSTIGFDADDTLWHNERFFTLTQDVFADLLSEHAPKPHLMERLLASEKRNIPHYGFGIKGFTLSMIETAIEVTQGAVPAEIIQRILDAGRDMLSHPVTLLPQVEETLEHLKGDFKLIMITKGDLLDQTRKIESSGLRSFFDAIEIVSHKHTSDYERIFSEHGTGADQGIMVGNSMASDILPMVQAGGWGVFIPHGIAWEVEHADPPEHNTRFAEISNLEKLPDLVAEITGKETPKTAAAN